MIPKSWDGCIRCHGPLDYVGSSLVGYCPICDKKELEAELRLDWALREALRLTDKGIT